MVFCFQQNIVVYIFACLCGILLFSKISFLALNGALLYSKSIIRILLSCLQWCFAFQQNILARAFSGFTLYMLACLLLVVFCFSAKYPFLL